MKSYLPTVAAWAVHGRRCGDQRTAPVFKHAAAGRFSSSLCGWFNAGCQVIGDCRRRTVASARMGVAALLETLLALLFLLFYPSTRRCCIVTCWATARCSAARGLVTVEGTGALVSSAYPAFVSMGGVLIVENGCLQSRIDAN